MADYLHRSKGIVVSWHYIATVWREEGPAPHRAGTFKVSRDPAGGAVVRSIDEKTQIQALDRTQPLLPIDFGVGEERLWH